MDLDMDQHVLLAPAHWASYLVNGDASGLDPAEKQAADEWIKSLGLGQPVSAEDAGFYWRHDAMKYTDKAAQCCWYTFLVPEKMEKMGLHVE